MAAMGGPDGRRPLRRLGATSARGAFLMLTSQGVVFGTNFVGIMILARSLAPAEFGLMAMAATVSNLIMMFRDFGLTTPVVQRRDLSDAQLSALYWINLAFGAALTALTVALAPLVAWFYGQQDLTLIVAILASGFLIGTTGAMQDALLRRDLRFGVIATIRSVSAVVTLIVGVAAAWLGYGIWALVIMRLVQQAALGIGSWSASRWRPGRYQRGTEVRSLLGVAGNVSASQLTTYLSRNADNVLIGWYWGEYALGLYDQAYKLLVFPMQQLGRPLNSILLPVLSKLADQPEAYREVYRRVTEKVVILSMPLTCLLLALPDIFVRVVLGPRWLDSVPIIAWLGIAMVYQPVAFTTGCLLMSQNRSRLMLRQGLVTSGVSILSFVVGLPFGPKWVAASYVISGALLRLPFIFWQVGKEGPVRTRDQYRLFIPTIWSGTFLTLSYYGLRMVPGLLNHPLLLLVCAGGITLPVTCATLALLPSGRALMRDSVTIIRLALSRSHAN